MTLAVKVTKSNKFCPSCGADAAGMTYCVQCGYDLAFPARRRVRFGLWPALAAGMSLLALVGGVSAAANLSSARSWEGRAGELGTELTGSREQLSKSESDVASLESRISSLSNEKARAEDDRAVAIERANLFSDIASLNSAVANQLNSCIASWERFARVVYVDAFAAGPLAVEGDRICNQAKSDYATLNALLGQL